LAWGIRDLRSGIKLSKSNRVMSASSGTLNLELIG